MKITVYQSVSNPDFGISINEEEKIKVKKDGTEIPTGKVEYTVWFDEYEGGHANDSDWSFEEEFKTKEEALSYIDKNYGKVKKIAVY
jgi:hypothetical protein